jgi:hypothetical protein
MIGRSIIICRVLLSLCSRLRERTQGPFCTVSHEMVLAHNFTEQQARFVERAADGLDLKDCALYAGYAESGAGDAATRLMREPAIVAAVQLAMARRLAVCAPASLRVLQDFVTDKTVDNRIRLAAAKTLLDRAGFIAPKAVDRTGEGRKALNVMNMDELRQERDRLEKEISDRAKPVSSAKAAPQDTQAIDDII